MSKYKNRKTVLNGETFDSAAECRRYQALLLMQRAGLIKDLTRQVSFVLAPKTVIHGKPKRSLIYRADFGYTETETGQKIVEDVKGMITDVYKVKRHLMMTIYNIEIKETK